MNDTEIESHSDSDSSADDSDSDHSDGIVSTSVVKVSDSNSTTNSDSGPTETETPTIIVDETASIIKNADLNLLNEDDEAEGEQIKNFRCKCKQNNGLPCYSQFMWESVRRIQTADARV